MQLHAEVVPVPLLCLMHDWVPLPSLILRRGRSLDDGDVHYRSLPQPQHPGLTGGGESPQTTPGPYRSVPAGGGSARSCFHPAAGPSASPSVAVPRIAAPTPVRRAGHRCPGGAQVVEYLHTGDSQHHRQVVGKASPARLEVKGTDALLQLLPGNQAVHPLQE